jgi:pimeloyl-ACP methyl ester carboxylesterase
MMKIDDIHRGIISVRAANHLGKDDGMTEARLHDGSIVEIEVHGEGPTLLLPENPRPVEGQQAEEMRKYGADPALGQALIRGLSDIFRVVAFDYQGNALNVPKPQTLTPDNVAKDILAVADAAKADRFAYYGYSWLAMVGLQLAIRTTRLSALVMGGFPPLNGPYAEMLRVTTASYEMAGKPQTLDDEWSSSALSKDQTQQFVTLYQALQGFDDRAAQAQITCPRLCFVGSVDAIQYGKNWGDVYVNLAGPIVNGRAELEALGWDVRVLEGLDHMQAMQAAQVVPILRSWWATKRDSLRSA